MRNYGVIFEKYNKAVNLAQGSIDLPSGEDARQDAPSREDNGTTMDPSVWLEEPAWEISGWDLGE